MDPTILSRPGHSNQLKREYIGVYYFKYFFGNIHKTPSPYSPVIGQIKCGDPLKVFRIIGQQEKILSSWEFVQLGTKEGFVLNSFLSERHPLCFQQKYPKFFNSISLDATERYYWNRLYDQFILIHTKVK